MTATRVDHGAVKDFVRHTLGCACPDEVFERIEVRVPAADCLGEIAIGGRLLVRCHSAESFEDLSVPLRQWLAAGIAARDPLGCHRLRLLLAARNPEETEQRALQIWESIERPDDRIHIHVLAPTEVETLLRAVGRSAPP
ncbi:MAG: hypothetical protein WBP72_01230 [Rhodocyclaceae bacterium]